MAYVQFPTLYPELWIDLAYMTLENYVENDNDCIILAPHRIMDSINYYRNLYKDSKIIGYNYEPVHTDHCISKEWLLKSFEYVDEVWDYDFNNVLIWNECGINAKFKPPQFTSQLKRINNSPDPDIDVLFIGSQTDYRSKYITNFNLGSIIPPNEYAEHTKYKFITAYQVWGALKDELISRSKIILNIAPFAGANQQQARIFYDLINNKCVLSEKSPHNYYEDLIIEFDNPNDLAGKIRYLLRDDNWKKYTNNSFEDYCKRKYK